MNRIDSYRRWDAAYVLGALTTADRHEYELHLSDCADCRAAVTELVAMPGILAAVPREIAENVSPDTEAFEAPSADTVRGDVRLLPGVLARIRHHRQRRRTALAGLVLASVAASVLASVVIVQAVADWQETPGQSQSQSQSQLASSEEQLVFTEVQASSLTAVAALESRAWGTEIIWECRYALPDDYASGQSGTQPHSYALNVTDDGGTTVRVATWTAGPGDTVTPTATTSIRTGNIRSLEIVSVVSVDSGEVLLTATT